MDTAECQKADHFSTPTGVKKGPVILWLLPIRSLSVKDRIKSVPGSSYPPHVQSAGQTHSVERVSWYDYWTLRSKVAVCKLVSNQVV